jgi:bifunctional DNA-binding transcriptional regulator/antitoxin component of YhaV-PrlF toxin-antitoxin module
MAELVLARVTQEGQMTIPQQIRAILGVDAGDYVALRPLMGGVFISKATTSLQVKAEDVLRQLVISLGREAVARGIRDDEDLDAIIEDVQQRAYEERYGGQAQATRVP